MDLFDINPGLLKYIEDHSTPEDPVLAELRRQTFLKIVHPRMLSGPVQGKFLELISKMMQPERILEIGTYTGYSAICLARGLKKGGKLITIEINDELEEIQNHFIEKSGLSPFIERITGDAVTIIPTLKETFDLIFIDGEKEEYSEYYRLSMPLLRAGGIIIADNVLWDGKVIDEKFQHESSTQAMNDFNKMIVNDPGTENLLLPLRDGLMIIRKIQ